MNRSRSIYRKLIKRATGCTDAEAALVEDVMRHDIFHSTLDWQTREELEEAAREGFEVVRRVGRLLKAVG
jgi:hypothetical protein